MKLDTEASRDDSPKRIATYEENTNSPRGSHETQTKLKVRRLSINHTLSSLNVTRKDQMKIRRSSVCSLAVDTCVRAYSMAQGDSTTIPRTGRPLTNMPLQPGWCTSFAKGRASTSMSTTPLQPALNAPFLGCVAGTGPRGYGRALRQTAPCSAISPSTLATAGPHLRASNAR